MNTGRQPAPKTAPWCPRCRFFPVSTTWDNPNTCCGHCGETCEYHNVDAPTDPQPVQYDSEREAISGAIKHMEWQCSQVAKGHLMAQGMGMAIDTVRDHLARVRAAPAPALANEADLLQSVYGGWHKRTDREIEISAILADTLPQDRSTEENAMGDLLTIIDGLRGIVWKQQESAVAPSTPRVEVSEAMLQAAIKSLYPMTRPEAWDPSYRERTRAALEAALRAGEVKP